ncbi:MAG: right-handed parallel beta-helix repeat-containing protein [Bacteroidia bacterium]|nr:right-handed parallel beta-helix repeat-containing protein [Bacteroidia bacterium]
MQRYYFGGILLILMSIIGISCERPVFTVEKGTLRFSNDTVKFDTIFTTFQSPSEWLAVINPTGNNIKVARIWLESGASSEFTLIIDGVKTQESTEVIIPSKDSIYVFVNMKSQARDAFVEDYLNFQIGNETQRVLIRAFVLDAYFYPTKATIDLVNGFISYDTAYCDLVLKNDKPHVISGPLYVPKGCNLTIEAGAQVHFTPYKVEIKPPGELPFYALYSMLHVAGTLRIQGQAGNPAVLQGSRLQTGPFYNYLEQPDQWRGIRLDNSSTNSIIEHAVIKNARVGVEVDSASVNGISKLTMRYTQIRNMAAYGMYIVNYIESGGVGSAPGVVVENSQISACTSNTLYIDRGGWNEFYNCTFDNSGSFQSKDATVAALNYIKYGDQIYGPYDIRTQFTNCAIWGSNDHEIFLGMIDGRTKEVNLENCLVKIDETEFNYDAYFTNVIKNQNPLFHNSYKWDYRPELSSPLINAGISNLPYNTDIRGRMDSMRTAPYDIGAYEYYPIE